MAKKAQAGVTLTDRPERLKPGMMYGRRANGDANYIKEIHELCFSKEGPHVHLLTLDGPICVPFSKYHTTYDPRKQKMADAVKRMAAANKSMAETAAKVKKTTDEFNKKFKVKGTVTGRIKKGVKS